MPVLSLRYAATASSFLFALLTGGCGLSKAEHRVVDRWLLCDDCTSGEREFVRALGERAIPRLTSALLQGPPADRRALMRTKFQRGHASLGPGIALTETEYVDELLSNYVATYQKHSALSLADIGGADARNVLDEALSPARVNSFRADVVRFVRSLRSTMDAARFTGTVAPSSVGVGDTVSVTAPPAEPFDGNELASLDDAPFASTEVRIVVPPPLLRFLAAGPTGNHTLTITNVGTTSDSQVTSLSIATLLDINDRATIACATLTCIADSAPRLTASEMPAMSILAFRRTTNRPDTLDAYRIENALLSNPLPVTVRLEWPASPSANLDLRWRQCSEPLASAGSEDGATQSNPENTSNSIPPGQCRLLLVIMVSGSTEPVFARLRVATQ